MNEKIYLETIEELDECKNNDEILQIVLDLKMQNADLSKMIEEFKRQLIKECKEHREAMQIADKRIKELEAQLENAIVPKFNIGQEVYYLDRYGVQKDIIVSFTYFSIENEILYKMHDEIIDHREKYIFVTKEEAQERLKNYEEL